MNGFFQQALAQQSIVAIETIEFLPQPECGHDRARPPDLCFAKDIFQNRDVEIHVGDGEKAPVPGRTRACMRCRISEE